MVDVETGSDVLPPEGFAAPAKFNEVWNLWPLGERNTVGKVVTTNGAPHVTVINPPGNPWLDFHLHSHLSLSFSADRKYRVTFRARATPKRVIYPAVYQILWFPTSSAEISCRRAAPRVRARTASQKPD